MYCAIHSNCAWWSYTKQSHPFSYKVTDATFLVSVRLQNHNSNLDRGNRIHITNHYLCYWTESSLSASVMFPLTRHPGKHVSMNYRSPCTSRETRVFFRDPWMFLPEKYSLAFTQASVPLLLQGAYYFKGVTKKIPNRSSGTRQALKMPAANSCDPRSIGVNHSPYEKVSSHSAVVPIVPWFHMGMPVRTFENFENENVYYLHLFLQTVFTLTMSTLIFNPFSKR